MTQCKHLNIAWGVRAAQGSRNRRAAQSAATLLLRKYAYPLLEPALLLVLRCC